MLPRALVAGLLLSARPEPMDGADAVGLAGSRNVPGERSSCTGASGRLGVPAKLDGLSMAPKRSRESRVLLERSIAPAKLEGRPAVPGLA